MFIKMLDLNILLIYNHNYPLGNERKSISIIVRKYLAI